MARRPSGLWHEAGRLTSPQQKGEPAATAIAPRKDVLEMHTYTVAAPRRNTPVAPSAQLATRPPIPPHIAAELQPAAREIWRRTRRPASTCNALAATWAGELVEG